MKLTALLISLFFVSAAFGQSFVHGRVLSDSGTAVSNAVIHNSAIDGMWYSDSAGNYKVPYIRKKKNILKFETPGIKPYVSAVPFLFEEEDYKLDVTLSNSITTYNPGGISDKREGRGDIVMKPLSSRPSVSGDFSDFIKTMAGVSSNNELSSQYNVRGGSYDENLIYVNDLEIYRPQLVRSGQQEGLSFINPDLVNNVNFSAGGFEARYGDKLSSVLDVNYRSPKANASGVQIGMLGATFFVEGVAKARKRVGQRDSIRFTYLTGARYRGNKNLLNTFDAEGLYKSRFGDLQSLFSWHFNRYNRLELLLNYAQNRYRFEPERQETTFGTLQSALKLSIGMDGQEIVDYRSGMGGLSFVHSKKRIELKFMASGFVSSEMEHYDIQGAYEISEVDNNLGSSGFGNAKALLGRGYFINHARNDLYFSVFNMAHQGVIKFAGIKSAQKIMYELDQMRHPGKLVYGIKYQSESINDRFKEWKFADSGGYNISSLPGNDSSIYLNDNVNSRSSISNQRVSGFFQFHQGFGAVNEFTVTAGTRYLYSSLNGQSLVSPRVQMYYEPNKHYNARHKRDSVPLKKNILLKAAFGYYYQAPFYREMRDFAGQLNTNLKAQRSIHYTAGMEFGFKSFGRPFKFSAEMYYKDLNYLVPYVLDNIRIRYYATNSARGYATGFDARINGEFIKGLESWFSFSVLKTDERITYIDVNKEETETGLLRRPTDRRVTASVMFQDELNSNKDYRMHLMMNFGTGLPYYLGGSARYKEGYTIPAYKRVDIGFSKVLIGGESTKIKSKLIRNMWIGADVYNLLQINNVISYLWVKDFSNTTYGVPNYLTGRRINLRLVAVFK